MTEAEWLACTDPTAMLAFLRRKARRKSERPSDRKLRLFACACCRMLWRWIPGKENRIAVEITERFADGGCGEDEFEVVRLREIDRERPIRHLNFFLMDEEVGIVTCPMARIWMARINPRCRESHPLLVRDIFANPFRPSPPLPPAVLAWNDRTVPRIAQAIYEDRKMPEGTFDTARLAILADALLDAGCDNEDLIQHCRSEGPHVRGCWAVDLILGKS